MALYPVPVTSTACSPSLKHPLRSSAHNVHVSASRPPCCPSSPPAMPLSPQPLSVTLKPPYPSAPNLCVSPSCPLTLPLSPQSLCDSLEPGMRLLLAPQPPSSICHPQTPRLAPQPLCDTLRPADVVPTFFVWVLSSLRGLRCPAGVRVAAAAVRAKTVLFGAMLGREGWCEGGGQRRKGRCGQSQARGLLMRAAKVG